MEKNEGNCLYSWIYVPSPVESCWSLLYLDVGAVGRKVHLHHKAGDVPAAVDPVQLRPERQVIEVNCVLVRAHGQVTGVWTEPREKGKFKRERLIIGAK